ncbi:MAG TPA: DUF4190 domain-containing protein [Verrucomicrobiae bacterium]|nr:DUF4190 domain-containing protein [Verrucomicrobiae bacterium]
MYYVIGADQREYGPVSAETVRAWIAQGRLTARSLARSDQTVGWRPLGDFPEFPEAIAQTAAPMYPSATVGQPPRTENNMALASLVLGCVSLVCCPFPLLPIAGLVLGLVALGQTKSHPAKGGRGLAIAGIAVSSAALVLFGVLAGFGVFREVIQRFFK